MLGLFFLKEQVGVYTPKGDVPPARHLSHIVNTKIRIINDTTKHYINYFICIFAVMEKNYVDDMSPKQKMGWKVLISIVRKKYPFIKDITIPIPLDTYGTFLVPNIIVDIEDLWKFYNVTPPGYYKYNPYLYNLLKSPRAYIFTYVDDQYEKQFSGNFNELIESYMHTAYRSLPNDMKYLQYEKWQGGEYTIESTFKSNKLTVEFRIREFIPIFDSSPYYKEEEGDLI